MTDVEIQNTLNDTPPPEMIEQQMRSQAMMIAAGNTLGELVKHVHGLVSLITNNNPRLALAICHELNLVFDEALRRSLRVTDVTPPASSNEVANV